MIYITIGNDNTNKKCEITEKQEMKIIIKNLLLNTNIWCMKMIIIHKAGNENYNQTQSRK